MASVLRRFPSDDISWYYPDVDESDGGPLFFQDVVGQQAWEIGEDFWEAAGGVILAVQPSAHVHSAGVPSLTQHHVLVSANSAHVHTAATPTLAQTHVLVVSAVYNALVSEQPTLTEHVSLTLANAAHAVVSETPSLAQHSAILPADAVHAHAAGQPSLTQAHLLLAASGQHAHTAEEPSLAQTHLLEVAQALHYHLADNLEVSAGVVLIVANALMGHASDEVLLTYQYAIYGVIRDKAGAPVPYADVHLFDATTNYPIGDTQSNTDGKYKFSVSDNTTDHFMVAHFGTSPRKAAVTVDTLRGK